MDLLTLLKELKKIEPDKDFSLRSRNFILNNEDRPTLNLWQILRSNIEFGASIALMVALVYVMLGGLASSNVGAPIQISNLDPAGLRAEAQAIDLQIKLTNLSYEGGLGKSLRISESTPSSTLDIGSDQIILEQNNSTSSDVISIDEALDKLSR